MAVSRPSNELKNKSNVNPVGNRLNEATAQDFTEISAILEELAVEVEGLNQTASENPYYGTWSSIELLRAAHDLAFDNGWAVIDAGPGITPQIAIWEASGQAWEIAGSESPQIKVANYAALPAPGLEGKFYITLNTDESYYWHSSAYHKILGGNTNTNTNVGNIDGGAPDSVYLIDQTISGGTP